MKNKSKIFKYGVLISKVCEHELTINQFSYLMGVSPSHIYKWLNGDTAPSLYYVAKMAKFFKCSIDTFVNFSEVDNYD